MREIDDRKLKFYGTDSANLCKLTTLRWNCIAIYGEVDQVCLNGNFCGCYCDSRKSPWAFVYCTKVVWMIRFLFWFIPIENVHIQLKELYIFAKPSMGWLRNEWEPLKVWFQYNVKKAGDSDEWQTDVKTKIKSLRSKSLSRMRMMPLNRSIPTS